MSFKSVDISKLNAGQHTKGNWPLDTHPFKDNYCGYRPDIHGQGWFNELEQRHGVVTVPEIESGKYDEFIRQWKEDHEDTKS